MSEEKELDIKPCPFCGNKAKVIDDKIINRNDGYDDFPYIVCQCENCNSLGEKIHIEYFNHFSKYTVADFRNSNLLRAQEELRYQGYLNNCRNDAIKKWNKRV